VRISDRLIKCVGFVSLDTEPLTFRGTVFLVSVPFDENSGVLHLVTAKHVASAVGDNNFVTVFNGNDGIPRFGKSGGDIRWFYHPTDESVDVAVMPFPSSMIREYDIQHIPISMFATDQRIMEYNIGLGDELVIVGLFTRFFGTSQIEPIVRTGNIAMMPREKIFTGVETIDAYLAEGRSIGGLSGSPVFCRSTLKMPTQSADGSQAFISGLGPFHLLGLMHGHWNLLPSMAGPESGEAVNMGISVVVPAKKILEVIYNPELVDLRSTAFRRDA
jgi:hypothetical protein